jgi:hypothetical protein
LKQFLIGALCALGLGLGLSATSARADEGMWTFDNFPSAVVKAKYGVTIDAAWLDKVRLASVRLSTGCSASVVSGAGLVLTNHHCVRDCAQILSTAKVDYVKSGFSAAARSEERLCPGMQAEILTGISDVTANITDATAGRTGQDFVKARDAAIAGLEKSGCAGHEATQRCQVINLYQGGQYKLYTYRKFSDVRLVFAPELQTAFFGGDPDNFNFPRYALDCAFVRLYEGGKPVATPGHLRWNPNPPKLGDPAFVAGNPGTTQRLLTADQLETLRDVVLPETLLQYSERRGRLIRFSEESAEHARIADGTLLGIENSFKAIHGQEQSLAAPGFIDAKRAADTALRAKVMADPALAAAIGDPWSEIAAVQPTRQALNHPYSFLEQRAGQSSALMRYARWLVRAAAERTKPNSERLPEYADARLALLQKQLLDDEPVYPDLEQLNLEFWLSKLRENLTADAPATRIFLGTDSPEVLSARLATSKLGDVALRRKLWDGGMAAIQASDDPMIRYVLATDQASRDARRDYEQRVAGPIDRAAARIAKARFAVYGTGAYPDATFSLRLSYGQVEGWMLDGQMVGPFTHVGGLWTRATGQFPFDLAPKWLAARGKINDDTIFDVTTNNDIIGGNSGSPLINAKAEVIGAVFDGNITSLGGNFGFDDKVNRGISVTTAAVTEALRKVYGATSLVDELLAR